MVKVKMPIFLHIHRFHYICNIHSFTIRGAGRLGMKTTVRIILNFAHTQKCKMLSQLLIQHLHV